MPLPRPGKKLLLALGVAVVALGGIAYWILRPAIPQQLADRIQPEVEEIRGLEFKHPVPVKLVNAEEWREFVLQELRKLPRVEHYWAAMRMLGVYSGPDLGAMEAVYAGMLAVPGAAYDARNGAFLLGSTFKGEQRKVVFAHELNHALQDQHFDMQRYLLDFMVDPHTTSDKMLARESVVEGEAAFVDALYQAKHATDAMPTRQEVANILSEEGNWDPANWEQMLANPALDEPTRARVSGLVEASRRFPPYMLEMTLCRYIDGYRFISEVQRHGWAEVAKLYGEYPPISTEQILHPEKWFAREEPVQISWPAFADDPLFADWQLLLEDTVGERVWQTVFRMQGLAALGPSAAAGWNGDRYVVFRHRTTESMLMLVHTAWDTPEDAQEFARAYQQLLEAKYPADARTAQMSVEGSTVRIVEGGSAESLAAFNAFNERALISDPR